MKCLFEISYRKLSDLSIEELKTLTTIYELVCHLMHMNECSFLAQFCDSVYIIASDLLRHIFANGMRFSLFILSAERLPISFFHIFID